MCGEPCYRKRFLSKEDLPPFILNGFVDDGISSWTTKQEYAANFKGFWREKHFGTLFEHAPANGEVVLSLSALWQDPDFVNAATSYAQSGGDNGEALINFRDYQGEIILSTPLFSHEVVGFTGKSSSFAELCDRAQVVDSAAQDRAFKALVENGTYPEEPGWIKVQQGIDPSDWKPMTSVGPGVREIRIWDDAGTFRVIYITKRADAVYVLHAFQKKTQQTAKRDLDLARSRLDDI